MAGGNFDLNTPKVRPGNYFNFRAQKKQGVAASSRGVVVVPLVGYDWGPDGEFVKLSADSPDGAFEMLGRSIYADEEKVMFLRLAMETAETVYAYLISGGKKASMQQEGGFKAEALYAGTRGNAIRI